jgi:hypothetical protein
MLREENNSTNEVLYERAMKDHTFELQAFSLKRWPYRSRKHPNSSKRKQDGKKHGDLYQ